MSTTQIPVTQADDYDSPWKEAIEHYFPEFMAFYFPVAYDGIDWSKKYTFLDNELRSLLPEAEVSISIYRRTLYQPYSVHVARNSSAIINGISTKTSTVIVGNHV